MQYMFSKKNWCLGALLISILRYSCRTLLMYLKFLCLLRAVFLLSAGEKVVMLLAMAFLNHLGASEHLNHMKSCFGLWTALV